MAKVKYVPIPLDMAEDIEELSDEEIGLVVRAYLQYGRSGETAEMPRTIKYLYNALVRELDRASDGYEKKNCGWQIRRTWSPEERTVRRNPAARIGTAQPRTRAEAQIAHPCTIHQRRRSSRNPARHKRGAGRSETARIPRHNGDNGQYQPACGGQRNGRSSGMRQNRRGSRKTEYSIPKRRN